MLGKGFYQFLVKGFEACVVGLEVGDTEVETFANKWPQRHVKNNGGQLNFLKEAGVDGTQFRRRIPITVLDDICR